MTANCSWRSPSDPIRPSRIRTIRCIRLATSSSWVTTNTVVPTASVTLDECVEEQVAVRVVELTGRLVDQQQPWPAGHRDGKGHGLLGGGVEGGDGTTFVSDADDSQNIDRRARLGPAAGGVVEVFPGSRPREQV